MPENQKITPVAWQKFGDDYCLTGQFGTRPIFLSVERHRKPALKLLNMENMLLVPFTPDHPHAKRIVDGWNNIEVLRAELIRAKDTLQYIADRGESRSVTQLHLGQVANTRLETVRAALSLCEPDPNS